MENSSTQQPNHSQGNDVVASGSRRKADISWKHCYPCVRDGKMGLKCIHCDQEFYGGGINRMKQHLAAIPGNAKPCLKITQDARFEIKGRIVDFEHAKQEKSKSRAPINVVDDEDVIDLDKNVVNNKRKRGIIGNYLNANEGIDKAQPGIQSAFLSKERRDETDLAIAMWFYEACIPINAANSPYFEAAVSRIAKMGHGYEAPSYHSLRVKLLQDAKRQVSLLIDDLRSKWVETGCTIMGDGWTDRSGRSLINFLVYCPHGIAFIKSVDASNIVSNAENLCNLFAEIVEIVGVRNVVHLVTDNASNYKAAGKMLNNKYPTIFWSPCSAHCINLIMKDISELENVKLLAARASRITVFVYNHKWPHAFLREREGWTEILRPGATRFGTTFIALRSLFEHKEHLEALVINDGFKKYLKTSKGREVKEIVLDPNFWNECLAIVKIMVPIMKLLRMCDSDEKPSLGYIYEGMARAIGRIKETFKNDQTLYGTFVNIVDRRWDKMLRKRLHAAAYWLNPAFQYDSSHPLQGNEAMTSLLLILQTLAPDIENIMNEIYMFRERKKTFGMKMAIKNAKTNRPDQWWSIFGGDAPNLQKVAIKILSQTSSASECERNWSVFERIHTKKRNRLEHQRLNDLVYVHYNLRLHNRKHDGKKSFDPIDYETIDKLKDWVVEELGELNINDLDDVEDDFSNQANTQTPTPRGIEDVDNDFAMINENVDLATLSGIASSSNAGNAFYGDQDLDESEDE